MFHPWQVYGQIDIFLSHLVMFMHKLANSSHTNADITPLHCSLALNIYLLQFILQQGEVQRTAFPQPPGQKLLPSARLRHIQESLETTLPTGRPMKDTNIVTPGLASQPCRSLRALEHLWTTPGWQHQGENLNLFSRAGGLGTKGPAASKEQLAASPAQAWARFSASALPPRSQGCKRVWPDDSIGRTPLAHWGK